MPAVNASPGGRIVRVLGAAVAAAAVSLAAYRLAFGLPSLLSWLIVLYAAIAVGFALPRLTRRDYIATAGVTVVTAVLVGVVRWIDGDAHEVGVFGAALEGLVIHGVPAVLGAGLGGLIVLFAAPASSGAPGVDDGERC